MSKITYCGKKKLEYYKGILIKADLGLHEQVLERIIELIPRYGRILDFGAGEGALSQRLVDHGYEVVAVDMDESNFKCSEAKFKKVDLNSLQEVIPFTEAYSNFFDVVLGVEVIEHIENQWEYVRLLKKMLKKKGYLIVTSPNITSWLSRLHFLFKGRFHQFADADIAYGHISPISQWELELILKREGFSEVNTYPAGTLPPLYLAKPLKNLILNAIALLFRPRMEGIIDGWCILTVARK